jgi:uncharacterized protein (TIGR02147 family)
VKHPLDPVKLLRSTLDERCKKNPQYSIRAFARASGISHTVLSLVLSGKRNLSKKATGLLADHLNLDPIQRNKLLKPFVRSDDNYQTLALDSFELISDWYHYAILSALELPGAKLEPAWMAKQIGIKPLQAKLAIDRLKRLALVKPSDDGSWVQSTAPIKIDNSLSTAATKKFHKQLLKRAAESIDRDPISDRDFSSMTFAMSASQIEFARKRIQTFRRELTAELESQGTPETVFNFTIQLYPVTPISKQEKK